jgi:hypothetical protein
MLVVVLVVVAVLVVLLLLALDVATKVVLGLSHGQLQLPDWHTLSAQKLSPVPHWPLWLQQSPHLPAHCRLRWAWPHVPSVL